MSQAQATSEHPANTTREFKVGTAGWTVGDLDDPRYNRSWELEHIELISGMVIEMPPAHFRGSWSSGRLLKILFQNAEFFSGVMMAELDLHVDDDTVFRPDFTWMSPSDDSKHRKDVQTRGLTLGKSRLAISPTLLVESISPGYQRHDRVFKFRRYAEFGVPNYWIIDGFSKTLDCYRLAGSAYVMDVSGKNEEVLTPRLFAPLTIPLAALWLDE